MSGPAPRPVSPASTASASPPTGRSPAPACPGSGSATCGPDPMAGSGWRPTAALRCTRPGSSTPSRPMPGMPRHAPTCWPWPSMPRDASMPAMPAGSRWSRRASCGYATPCRARPTPCWRGRRACSSAAAAACTPCPGRAGNRNSSPCPRRPSLPPSPGWPRRAGGSGPAPVPACSAAGRRAAGSASRPTRNSPAARSRPCMSMPQAASGWPPPPTSRGCAAARCTNGCGKRRSGSRYGRSPRTMRATSGSAASGPGCCGCAMAGPAATRCPRACTTRWSGRWPATPTAAPGWAPMMASRCSMASVSPGWCRARPCRTPMSTPCCPRPEGCGSAPAVAWCAARRTAACTRPPGWRPWTARRSMPS
ncbi:MAG: hypothetical protein KatS3mg127_1903 [Silanimonas sp.]|nr:MAG: hypothetical protein KatS3mg127_1903 [Silanimonas sp.]